MIPHEEFLEEVAEVSRDLTLPEKTKDALNVDDEVKNGK